jgi:hypothetical protein
MHFYSLPLFAMVVAMNCGCNTTTESNEVIEGSLQTMQRLLILTEYPVMNNDKQVETLEEQIYSVASVLLPDKSKYDTRWKEVSSFSIELCGIVGKSSEEIFDKWEYDSEDVNDIYEFKSKIYRLNNNHKGVPAFLAKGSSTSYTKSLLSALNAAADKLAYTDPSREFCHVVIFTDLLEITGSNNDANALYSFVTKERNVDYSAIDNATVHLRDSTSAVFRKASDLRSKVGKNKNMAFYIVQEYVKTSKGFYHNVDRHADNEKKIREFWKEYFTIAGIPEVVDQIETNGIPLEEIQRRISR